MTDSDLPPSSQEAELAVLGCILLDRHSIVGCALKPEDFYYSEYRRFYDGLLGVIEEFGATDPVLVSERLGDWAKPILLEAMNAVGSPANIGHYAKIIREKSSLRKIIAACRNALNVVAAGENAEGLLEKIQQVAYEAGLDRENATPISQIVDAVLIDLDQPHHADWETGIASLDKVIGGLNRQEFMTVYGESSHGKSSVWMSLLLPAIQSGAKVMVCDYEMGSRVVTKRMLSMVSNTPLEEASQRRLSEYSRSKIQEASAEVSKFNVIHLEGPSLTEIHARARQWQADIIVYDYIQNAFDSEKRRDENENSCITRIVASLKRLALQANLSVIAVSQVTKDLPSGRPRKSNLKMSGGIYDGSDKVLCAWWPMKRGKDVGEATYVIGVDKNKNGQTGDVVLQIQPWCLRLIEPTTRPSEAEIKEATE